MGSSDGNAVPATCEVTVKRPVGDVNVDGRVDIADAVTVLNAMAGQQVAGNADVNGDQKFTIADVVHEANYIKGTSAENFEADEADANSDGEITIADVVEIANSVKNK